MTNTPVKGIDSIMNYVGAAGAPGKSGSGDISSGFGDIMNRATGKPDDSKAEAVSNKKTSDNKISYQNQTSNQDRIQKSQENTPKEVDQVDKQQVSEKMQETGEKMVDAVAEELSVTPEEVAEAMAALGLTPIDLLIPQNLTDLALQITGEDVSALMTSEELCLQVNNLMQVSSELMNGIAEDMNVNAEDLQQMIQDIKADMPGDPNQPQSVNELLREQEVSSEDVQEPEGEVKITIQRDGEVTEMKLGIDERGNTQSLTTATTTKSEGESKDSGTKSQNDSMSGQEMQGGNSLINTIAQTDVEAVEVQTEQLVTFTSEQTQDIMNQVMDYMKIQLSPGMNQLEMQLHPASLGTVNVSIVSEEGNIKAHFTAQDESVKAVLESKIQDLTETLRNQGIKVEAVEVTVETHAFESNLWQGQERNDQNGQPQKKSTRRINLNDLQDEGLPEDLGEEERIAAEMMQANGNTVDFTA